MIYTGFYDYNDSRHPAVAEASSKKYDALSDAQKKLFHEELPPVLMAVCVGIINEHTVLTIARRLALICPSVAVSYGKYQLKVEKSEKTTWEFSESDFDVLARFFMTYDGLVSNVGTDTDARFLRKIANGLPKLKLTAAKKKIEDERKAIIGAKPAA